MMCQLERHANQYVDYIISVYRCRLNVAYFLQKHATRTREVRSEYTYYFFCITVDYKTAVHEIVTK